MRETGNESGADRITDTDEHNRHIPRYRLDNGEREITAGNHDIGRRGEHVGDDRLHLLWPACPPTHVGSEVVTVLPAQFVEPRKKDSEPSFFHRALGDAHKGGNPPYTLALLCPRRSRALFGERIEFRRANFQSERDDAVIGIRIV